MGALLEKIVKQLKNTPCGFFFFLAWTLSFPFECYTNILYSNVAMLMTTILILLVLFQLLPYRLLTFSLLASIVCNYCCCVIERKKTNVLLIFLFLIG